MSSVKLGDASIRVTIDPAAAKSEADRLKKELQKLDEMRKKAQDEMERALRGETSMGQNRPDPNTPGGGGARQAAGAGSPPVNQSGVQASGREEDKGKGAGGRHFQDMIGSWINKARIAAEAIKASSAFSSYAKETLKGTMFEGLASGVDEQVQKLAERVNKLESAYEGGFVDTVTDVVDFNIAALKLGGKFPADQKTLIADFAEINYQQSLLRKDIDLATKRSIYEVMPEAIRQAFLR